MSRMILRMKEVSREPPGCPEDVKAIDSGLAMVFSTVEGEPFGYQKEPFDHALSVSSIGGGGIAGYSAGSHCGSVRLSSSQPLLVMRDLVDRLKRGSVKVGEW